jgi:hypothetical protein
MTEARATIHKRRRQRERIGVVAVFVLAAIAGLLAAHNGSRRPWDGSQASQHGSTSTLVPFVEPQRIP